MTHEYARIGARIPFDGYSLVIKTSTNGCKGCFFETENGAIDCPHTSICFAHKRGDRQSVMFLKTEIVK